MPAAVMLVASLVVNYLRHLRGKSTICSTFRRNVSRRRAALFLACLFSWLVPHLLLGYARSEASLLREEREPV